ncbi:MAG: hypothetical protein EPN25_10700 [Nitrospirae bacterium]|nr:MAG: hypothetical protein EPN25_10700 [Nitrospirota bacterium]
MFLDANVLFTAAHNPDGKAALIIALGAEGVWELRASAFAVEEARRNIIVKYPAMSAQFDELLTVMSMASEQPGAPFPDGLAEKDRPIFQAALGCKATHLITGDTTHFGRFMMNPAKTLGIIVMTPAQFLEAL